MENGAVHCDGLGGCADAGECRNEHHTAGRHEALCQNDASCAGSEWPVGERQPHTLYTHAFAPPARKEHINSYTCSVKEHLMMLLMYNYDMTFQLLQ